MAEDNGSSRSGGGKSNGSTMFNFTSASVRGASMSNWDPFGGPSGPAPF